MARPYQDWYMQMCMQWALAARHGHAYSIAKRTTRRMLFDAWRMTNAAGRLLAREQWEQAAHECKAPAWWRTKHTAPRSIRAAEFIIYKAR